jgi:aspartyl-tRNA(Asn)/glutamyl-tRNA(Gln) amidotransferase subunit C
MALTRTEVHDIAHLARLEIAEEEMPVYAGDLSGIIDLVNQLQAVDTEGVTPMAHPLDMSQRLRNDEISESDQRELYQQNAPQVETGLYLVPKVIE